MNSAPPQVIDCRRVTVRAWQTGMPRTTFESKIKSLRNLISVSLRVRGSRAGDLLSGLWQLISFRLQAMRWVSRPF